MAKTKKNTKLENTIVLNYKESSFKFQLFEESISYHSDFDYHKKCDSSNKDCDHDYSRCMRICDITFKNFNKYDLVKNNVSLVKGDVDILPEVVELICRALSGIDFSSYIKASAEADYYGDSLVKHVDLKDLYERVVTNFKIERFEDVRFYD